MAGKLSSAGRRELGASGYSKVVDGVDRLRLESQSVPLHNIIFRSITVAPMSCTTFHPEP